MQLSSFIPHGEQVSSGMQAAVRHGQWPCSPPLGYRNLYWNSQYITSPDFTIGALLQEVFSLAESNRYSIRELLGVVTERGLRSKQGKPLSVSAFYKILTNPFYCGQLCYKGELRPGNHYPLINEKTFKRISEEPK